MSFRQNNGKKIKELFLKPNAYFFMSNPILVENLKCDRATIDVDLIFVSRPEVFQSNNCKITGKVLYLSDPKTCEEYGDNSLIADICHPAGDL